MGTEAWKENNIPDIAADQGMGGHAAVCQLQNVSIAVDDKGKKRKAQGGERVMYTSHNACWDAKNRFGLPDEVPFDYKVIQSIIEQGKASADMKPYKAAEVPKTRQLLSPFRKLRSRQRQKK